MVRRYCFAAVMAIGFMGLVYTGAIASQTLTLTLESPSLSNADIGKPVQRQSRSVTEQSASSDSQSKSADTDSNTVRVGHVGVVQTSTAVIYRSKSASAARYASVKCQTPLAIVKEERNWYGVLMSNGGVGWIQQKCVKLIGFDLVANRSDIGRSSISSRSGDVSRSDAVASELMTLPDKFTGTPYVFGGTDPTSGLDCSAFVRMVFDSSGIHLPRTAREQAKVGETVPLDQLQPGDRLYFSCKNPYIDHCGIYCGNGYFVHCSKSRNGVGIDSLTSDFYWRHLVMAKRS